MTVLGGMAMTGVGAGLTATGIGAPIGLPLMAVGTLKTAVGVATLPFRAGASMMHGGNSRGRGMSR